MNRSSAIVALITLPALVFSADQPLQIPVWLNPYPGATGETNTASHTGAEMSYTSVASPATVIQHYEAQLRKAGVIYKADFDGIGTAIRATEGATSCVV